MDYPEAPIWEKARRDAEQLEAEADPNTEQFLLRIWGSVEEHAGFQEVFGKPVEKSLNDGRPIYAFWFKQESERVAFREKVLAFCKSNNLNSPVLFDLEGPLLRKYVISVVKLKYRGKEYEVKEGFGYGYPLDIVIFEWEENNRSCDSRRMSIIERDHPGTLTEKDKNSEHCCGDGHVPVVDFRFELVN